LFGNITLKITNFAANTHYVHWIYILIAGVFEIGWPLGMKLSQTTGNRILWLSMAGISMLLSGLFLWLAQKQIPIGTAYAVWTGIGASGTFFAGILFFGESQSMARYFFVGMILMGVIGLKLATKN
jgi:quaternary ammonium compound-resistance protein SugE